MRTTAAVLISLFMVMTLAAEEPPAELEALVVAPPAGYERAPGESLAWSVEEGSITSVYREWEHDQVWVSRSLGSVPTVRARRWRRSFLAGG